MTYLITGGTKCGRSRLAETLLQQHDGCNYYIATMQPYGTSAQEAIARHREQRAGKGFVTLERYTRLDTVQVTAGCGVLVECLGNLCANELFGTEDPDHAAERILAGIRQLRQQAELLILVTSQVGADGIAYPPETMRYLSLLGEINCRAAAMADTVVECIYGIPVALKGVLPC